MTTIVWVGLIIVVAIAAFFVGASVTKKQFKHEELEKEVESTKNELAQYKQDVADHLAGTKKLVSKMQDNYQHLLNHMEETNQLLLNDRPSHPTEPFFSKETTEQLQASLQARPEKRRQEEPAMAAPPSDYVEGTTGLFEGKSTKKEQTESS